MADVLSCTSDDPKADRGSRVRNGPASFRYGAILSETFRTQRWFREDYGAKLHRGKREESLFYSFVKKK